MVQRPFQDSCIVTRGGGNRHLNFLWYWQMPTGWAAGRDLLTRVSIIHQRSAWNFLTYLQMVQYLEWSLYKGNMSLCHSLPQDGCALPTLTLPHQFQHSLQQKALTAVHPTEALRQSPPPTRALSIRSSPIPPRGWKKYGRVDERGIFVESYSDCFCFLNRYFPPKDWQKSG